MVSLDDLIVGQEYDRPFLAKIWGYKSWHAIGRGIVTPKNENLIILFVTNKKQDALTQYKDYMENNHLYMEGEKNHFNDNRLVNSLNSNDQIFLFYRERHHAPFIFYGKVYLIKYSIKQKKPSFFVFILNNDNDEFNTSKDRRVYENSIYYPEKEGKKKYISHVFYERSRKNRTRAIELHGTTCSICGFNFNQVYGSDLAQDYIEIHHIKPLSETEGLIDPLTDLIPLCSNCHSMIHRRKDKILSISELEKIIKKQDTDNRSF